MRATSMLVLSAVLLGGAAFAQNAPPSSDPSNDPAANAATSRSTTGAPGQAQPQGRTGPTSTTSGGAPASSPQGDTPPGMQPNPHDSKQGIDPKK